jgi:hypothetical protein
MNARCLNETQPKSILTILGPRAMLHASFKSVGGSPSSKRERTRILSAGTCYYWKSTLRRGNCQDQVILRPRIVSRDRAPRQSEPPKSDNDARTAVADVADAALAVAAYRLGRLDGTYHWTSIGACQYGSLGCGFAQRHGRPSTSTTRIWA